MTTVLLHTKLMPPRVRAPLIARPELTRKLEAGLDKKLTLVSAPTGFGKTTLVSLWLAEQKIASAWVTLDENDNDPVRFWTYVITGLRRLDGKIGKAALTALATSQTPTFQILLPPLLNELAELSQPAVLVLEDYQGIRSAEIQAAVTFMLQHLPEALHLVIISRIEPNLPLGILRARGELIEIHAADLRFGQAEIEAFLHQSVPGGLPPSAAQLLRERTEGWAAGLRLAALSLQNRGSLPVEKVLEGFTGSHRNVADYLAREVLATLAEDLQTFLLKTCLLSPLTGPLCDAVTETGGGEAILEQLERDSLFLVRLEPGRGRAWYRYSPLFAESMQTLARQRLGAAGLQAVSEKASAWYAGQQMYAEAVETALAAGLFERAIALIETFVEIYGLNEIGTLTRWLANLPEALTLRYPAACLIFAQVILFSSDRFAPATAARVEPYLRAAETTWQAAGDQAHVGEVLAMRGMMLIWQGDFAQARSCVQRSLDLLPESEVFWRGISWLNAATEELNVGHLSNAQDQLLEARALLGASQNVYGLLGANGMMSDIFFAKGDLELCAQLSRQILEEAVGDESMLDDQGEARLRLALVAYEQNDLAAAAGYAAAALELGQRRGNEVLQAQAASRLAMIHAAQGDPAARAELKTLAARLNNRQALHEVRETEAWLAVRAGERLQPWPEPNPATHWAHKERGIFILAGYHIAEDRPAAGRVRSQVEALCLTALAQAAAGDRSQAREQLTQALTLGQAKGFRRLFLDEGARMAAQLRETLPALRNRTLNLYAATLLHLFALEGMPAPQGSSDSPVLAEPLSRQETRVLKLLAAGLSNGEIAQELVVSTNTVKTHVKNIYRKLGISSREEARAMVKALKLP